MTNAITEDSAEARELREADERLDERLRIAEAEARRERVQCTHADFVYDRSQDKFWSVMDGALLPDRAVDNSIPRTLWRVEVEEAPPEEEGPRGRGRPRGRPRERPIRPSLDIMRIENDQFCESSTWWPGQPRIIHDFYIDNTGYHSFPGRRAYNRYRPPPISAGAIEAAGPWIEHVKTLWPEPAEHNHFFDYCAHMVQRPEVKCNSAVIISGAQGIGKDGALEAVKRAIGSWNSKNIDPDQLFSDYKPWIETLMLIIDEARPTKDDFHSSSMYNILKPLTAAPPNVLPLNDKFQNLRYVVNVMRVFITTNDYMSLFVPKEDRRLFIMHSPLAQGWHIAADRADYFERYWAWLEDGGYENVAAWLSARDLSAFNAKLAPPKTTGWSSIADSWHAPEDSISAALEKLENPAVLFGIELVRDAFDHKDDINNLIKSPRKLVHRMQQSGYTLIPPIGKAERWSFTFGDKKFRSRYAFAKAGLCSDMEVVVFLLQSRGAEIAERLAKTPTNVTPLRPQQQNF